MFEPVTSNPALWSSLDVDSWLAESRSSHSESESLCEAWAKAMSIDNDGSQGELFPCRVQYVCLGFNIPG
jgi:hypothetical protein